ncbi:unnamed protein product, partial [Mesorhabditis belari]|uniref:RRM domain-containing protein n=1 Tax=Mesorhabditis belari TaxID=2138241 RepID=A0AAF3EAL0_9BILA
MSEPDKNEITSVSLSTAIILDELPEMGSWADIMQNEEPEIYEDSHQESIESNDTSDSAAEENDEGSSRENTIKLPDGRHVVVRPPYSVRVRNVNPRATTEDLFFHFGGRDAVEEVDFDQSRSVWTILMATPDFLEHALTLHNSYMFSKQIQVLSPNIETSDDGYGSRMNNGSNRGYRDSRNYPGHSQQFPQQSHYSNQNFSYSSNIQPLMTIPTAYHPNGYGALTAQENQYQGNRNYPQKFDKQRSQQQNPNRVYNSRMRDQPGRPSFDSDRGDMPGEISKRTSSERVSTISLASCDTQKSTDSVATIRKPTNKDLFGDAKPVDTTAKLLEIENRKKDEEKKTQQQQQQKTTEAEPHHPRQSRDGHPRDSRYYNQSGEERKPSTSTSSTTVIAVKENKQPHKADDYGSVTILPRPSVSKDDQFDASPPNDPIQHTTKNTPSPSVTITENLKVRTFRGQKTRGHFSNNQNRSNTNQPIESQSVKGHYRGRGGGNRGNYSGRGGRGGTQTNYNDRTNVEGSQGGESRTATDRKNSFTARESHSLNVSFENTEKSELERKNSTPVTSSAHPEEPIRGKSQGYRGSQRGFKTGKKIPRSSTQEQIGKGKNETEKGVEEKMTKNESASKVEEAGGEKEGTQSAQAILSLPEDGSEKASKEKRRKKPNKERQMLNAMPKIDDKKVVRPVNCQNRFDVISNLPE